MAFHQARIEEAADELWVDETMLHVRLSALQPFEREWFAEQPAAYRESVLPKAVTARVSVEAGVTFGWDRWIGEKGIAIGVDGFGASAPDKVLFEKYGLTVTHVVEAAKKTIG